DDVAVGDEGVGDEDGAAGGVHEVADGAGHGGLAVAGRAVDEHGTAANDRGPQRREHLFLQNEMAERRPQSLRETLEPGDRLPVALFDVILERDRRRADIGALFHRVLSALAAEVREAELDAMEQYA